MNKIYLMDASAFIHRSFHAIRNLQNQEGFPTGAIYGYTTTLLKLIKEKKPQYLAVVFDSKGPNKRNEFYPQYKANRPPMDQDLVKQQEDIREITKNLGLFMLEQQGHEADDLIAVLCQKFKTPKSEIIIISADKDFYQLLDNNVYMYDPNPRSASALNLEEFQKRFEGIEAKNFLEMQGLMGDSSDNIPGVPGVGEKTALKLIGQYQTLDNIYQNIESLKPVGLKKKLIEHKESAYISKKLAKLGHEANLETQLEDLKIKTANYSELKKIFNKLEFNKLLKEIIPTETRPQEANLFTNINNENNKEVVTISPISNKEYKLIENEEDWNFLISSLNKTFNNSFNKNLETEKRLALDVETNTLNPSLAHLVGLSVCAEEGVSFYIPINHQTLGAQNQNFNLVLEKLKPFLLNKEIGLVGQNAKYDWYILNRHGLKLKAPADDPMLASYLLNPELRHGLDYLSPRHLGHETIPFKEIVPPKKNFGDLSPEEALIYAAEDSDITLRLANILREELKKQPRLLQLYTELELPLEELLARIEGAGVLVDLKILSQMSEQFSKNLKTLEEEIFSYSKNPFNIASPQQLATVLFEEIGLTPIKKTAKKTSYSTDDEVLAELALIHPLPKTIRTWRTLAKLKSTYTDKLPKEVSPETGRIHTSYNQTLTATGRLSSSEPNLQNIPVKGTEGRQIRSAFIAQKGYKLISADYSQIELRILAHYSQDETLVEAFNNNEDIHSQTAAKIFNLNINNVTEAQRREAKTINFGVIYGQGAFGLAKQLGIPQAQARDFINEYFLRFPKVKQYMATCINEAKLNNYVETWFGRKRWLSNINATNYHNRAEAERMAVNTPIQGTAADLIKMAMLTVDNKLNKFHNAKIIMQVHDELVIEARQEDALEIKNILIEEMALVGKKPPLTEAKPLKTNLKVDVGIGDNWFEAHL